jgi:hypothetical protein
MKYAHTCKSNKIPYKEYSTVAAWATHNQKLYDNVKVKFKIEIHNWNNFLLYNALSLPWTLYGKLGSQWSIPLVCESGVSHGTPP